MPAVAGLSFVIVLFAPLDPLRIAVLSRWQPSIFFGGIPALWGDFAAWPLAVGFSCAVLSSVLVQLGRLPQPRFSLGLSVLGMLATGLGSIWSENLLMLLLCWAGFDLAWGLGAAAADLPARRVTMGVGLGALATVALWAGALAVDARGGSLSWLLMDLSGPGRDLLWAAAALRLGLYPLHMALPVERTEGPPGAASLMLGPVLGWALLLRLAEVGGSQLAVTSWAGWLAGATFLAGGLLAWLRGGSGAGWPYASLAAAGGVLWASLVAGDAAAQVLAAGGASWVLGVTLLHMSRGMERAAPWWSVAPIMGGLTLLGAPLTWGLVSTIYLLGSPVAPLTVGRAVVFLFAQGLLTAAVAHRVFRPAPTEEPIGPLHKAARAAGLILPAALLLIAGLRAVFRFPALGAPSLAGRLAWPGAVGFVLWLAGLALGGVLYDQERRGFRQRMEAMLGLLCDLFRLDWLWRLLLASQARLVAFLSAVADVMEGPGAILWALAIFLLVLLMVTAH